MSAILFQEVIGCVKSMCSIMFISCLISGSWLRWTDQISSFTVKCLLTKPMVIKMWLKHRKKIELNFCRPPKLPSGQAWNINLVHEFYNTFLWKLMHYAKVQCFSLSMEKLQVSVMSSYCTHWWRISSGVTLWLKPMFCQKSYHKTFCLAAVGSLLSMSSLCQNMPSRTILD